MSVVVVTGSAGLIGAETVRFFAGKGYQVVGVDNDMRKSFFGKAASTDWSRRQLEQSVARYQHRSIDIRDADAIDSLFQEFGRDIRAVIHTAAQPSHDWAARDPHTDFTVNANGTLNLLEATRKFAPLASFIFTSTNKVYGDNPMPCLWSNSNHAGKSTVAIPTLNMASTNRVQLQVNSQI